MVKRYTFVLTLLICITLLFRALIGNDMGEEWRQLKVMLIPVASLYLSAFNSAATPIVLCTAMILVGGGILAYYGLGRIAPALRDTTSLVRELKSTRGAPGTPEVMQEIDAIMSRNRVGSRGWTLYRSGVFIQPNGFVRSLFPPSRYFDLKALELVGLRLRFFMQVPNDFVGVGLVFTFLGLVAGLYFAAKSMMSADLGSARSSLVMLLHAATFKFLTSSAGIGISLVLTWAQRMLVDQLEAKLSEIQFLIEERLPLAGSFPTDIGVKIKHEIKDARRKLEN